MDQQLTAEKIKIVNVTVFLLVIFIVWNTFNSIPYTWQIVFFLLGMLISGIPHGALDHIVQHENERRNHRVFNHAAFFLKYLGLIALYALAWYLLPQLSLVVFILMSCWHFGETDVIRLYHHSFLTALLRLTYGIAVIGWLLLTHHQETTSILGHILKVNGMLYRLWSELIFTVPANYMLILLIAVLAAPSILKPVNKLHAFQFIQLLIIIIGGCRLPLLLAFVLYFAGWHSVITLFNIKFFLNQHQVHKNTEQNLWIKALPYSLLAIAGLLITAFVLKYLVPSFNPIPLVFIFLSVITLPHMQVMHALSNRLSTNQLSERPR